MADPNIVNGLLEDVREVHGKLSDADCLELATRIENTRAYLFMNGHVVPSRNAIALAEARRISRGVVDRIAHRLAPVDDTLSDAEKLARAEQRMNAMGLSLDALNDNPPDGHGDDAFGFSAEELE